MKLDTVNKTSSALKNIKDSIELEMCVLPISERAEYEEYFKEIEGAIIKVQDRFFREWIYNNQVNKIECTTK